AEARREENEIAVLAQDFLPLCFPGLAEPGMQQIEAWAAGDVITANLRKKTLEVLLFSFAPEKQIVDVLEGLAEHAAIYVVVTRAVGETLLAHDGDDVPGSAN